MKDYNHLQKRIQGYEDRINSIKINFEAMIEEEEKRYNNNVRSLKTENINKITEYQLDMKDGINNEKKSFIREFSDFLDVKTSDDTLFSSDLYSEVLLMAKEHINAMLKIREKHPYNDKDTDDDSKIGISITQEEDDEEYIPESYEEEAIRIQEEDEHQERVQRDLEKERIEREKNELEETFERLEKEKEEKEEILKNAKLKL